MHKSDLQHSHERLQDKLNSIYQLRRTTTKVNWDQAGYLTLLEKFGNPHKNLPPIIHVAGTNGKGSVIALLRAMLEAQGLRVHSYTSPHLIEVNERIVLAGAQIDNAALESLIDQAMDYNDDAPLSFFEIITSVAFKAFYDTPADVLLLEVGMGGRLDCTNVIDSPLVSIINRVSLDHTEFLGSELSDVVREKAGIMKPGVSCVVGYQGGDYNVVYGVIEDEEKRIGANPIFYGQGWDVSEGVDGFVFRFGEQCYDFPLPSLAGGHQIYNAGAALAALFAIRDNICVSDEAMKSGLSSAIWPGRLQQLNARAFGVLAEQEIWLDSGHNDSAGMALAMQLKQWKEYDARPVLLILGMLKTKDSRAFLDPILPYVESVSVVPIGRDVDGCIKGEDIQAEDVRCYDDVDQAVRSALGISANARVLIAGSVYLAGDVLKIVQSKG